MQLIILRTRINIIPPPFNGFDLIALCDHMLIYTRMWVISEQFFWSLLL